jgi:purine-binding chemotaxis protein CheW
VDPHDREILVFEIAGQRYGLPVTEVRELVRAVAIVPLPLARPPVEGVVDLRGQIVPVIDLRSRLGLPTRPVSPSDHMIVAQSKGRVVALRIDRAIDLVPIDADSTAGVGVGTGTGTVREIVEGQVAQLADGLAPLLDLQTVLAGTNTHEEGVP